MIEIENLSYNVKNSVILKDINLILDKGEFASIIGPNGAGKSSLIKIILGLIPGFTGEIYIDGEMQKSWLKRNIIGYVPQKESFDRDFPATAMDIVLMGIAGKKGLFRYFNREDRIRAGSLMERVGIKNHRETYIGSLSGGEFQRVLLARALMCDPDYLFLDEPEAGVDMDGVVHFYNLLKELHNSGKTILTITHDVNTTIKYCSQLICLNKTLHYHDKAELAGSDVIEKTFGDVIQLIERK